MSQAASDAPAPAGLFASAGVEPVVQVTRLGFVALDTPQLDAMVAYYRDVLDFALVDQTDRGTYLTADHRHHCVVLEEAGSAKARTRVGFEVSGPLGAVWARLRDRGIEAGRCSDPEAGIGDAVVIHEPSGTPLYLYEQMESSGVGASAGIRPIKLGHVASFVTDLQATQRFYEDVLGFRWSDTIGDFFVFLRCNVEHHAVNFIRSTRRTGTHHIAYEARDWAHLKEIIDHLAMHGYRLEWGPGRHGVGHNIFAYHRDPDGHFVEMFTEIDLILDEQTGYFEPRPWHESFPQGPRVWEPRPEAANKWGPVNMEMNEH